MALPSGEDETPFVPSKKKPPVSALSQLPKAELVRTYVWEKPVRISHWLIFLTFISLTFTGLYMHRPFLLSLGRPSFLMARMRLVHVVSGFVLIAAMLLRIYWFFKGNFWARWSAYLPIRRKQWEGMGDMLEFYLFMRFSPGHRGGHNPLAAFSYAVIYLLIVVEILTGLALYGWVLGNPAFNEFIGWLPQLIDIRYLRMAHYFLTFVFWTFAIFHVYASILVSLEEENGLVDSIFSGWKFMPAADLRHELASIPEARRFAKRHELLPAGTPDELRAGTAPQKRPGPGPVALYRNRISYAGTGIAAVGVLVFVILTAYHTIGGGALIYPYGDLVIFFVPPMFVIAGIAVILVGMWVQWIHWRMHKPLSFARFPKWDLNVASERKALLAVALGAAIISVPSVFGGYQAYLYTDDVSFCGAVCHSMSPEFTTYRLSPHAHVTCAQCHVGPGATGYLSSKIRGMVELVETVQNDYPRPIPAPVTALHTIQTNCEQCHWPSNLFGTREVRRVHFMSDEQNTRWETDLLVSVGGSGASEAAPTGIHWHVASKVEYIASDPERQNISWVRYVDPNTGLAKVFVSQGKGSSATPAGEIRTMDCVDCHNRPSHILQSPEETLDAALADAQIDSSLPYIKQRGVAALGGSYGSREQAMQGIESTLRGYYQKNYAKIAADKPQTIDAAVAYLQGAYDKYYFPAMKVRWDTYTTDDGHYTSLGCFRCHDAQHKSADGSMIRSDCNDCHRILRQGKTADMQFAKGPDGLAFQHPVDIADLWQQQACSSCHTGGAQ